MEADLRLNSTSMEAKKLTVVLADTSDRCDIGDVSAALMTKQVGAQSTSNKKVVTLDNAGVCQGHIHHRRREMRLN